MPEVSARRQRAHLVRAEGAIPATAPATSRCAPPIRASRRASTSTISSEGGEAARTSPPWSRPCEIAREHRRAAARARPRRRGELPGPDVQGRRRWRNWIRDNAWGHHASVHLRRSARARRAAWSTAISACTASRGLRVVDASIFPRIPGFFIVSAVYMVAREGRRRDPGGRRCSAHRNAAREGRRMKDPGPAAPAGRLLPASRAAVRAVLPPASTRLLREPSAARPAVADQPGGARTRTSPWREETIEPDEEASTCSRMIDTMREHLHQDFQPGEMERAGNTKTHGIVRASSSSTTVCPSICARASSRSRETLSLLGALLRSGPGMSSRTSTMSASSASA